MSATPVAPLSPSVLASCPICEKWKPIPQCPGYEASSEGRIRSVQRLVIYADGRRRSYPGQVLKQWAKDCQPPYMQVSCSRKLCKVHILVASAFHGPKPSPAMECRHVNGNSFDNRPGNLRWGTHSENVLDTVLHGRHPMAKLDTCARGHALLAPNLEAYALRSGSRNCKSCHRAHHRCSYWKRAHGIMLDHQAVADEQYSRIMGGVAE